MATCVLLLGASVVWAQTVNSDYASGTCITCSLPLTWANQVERAQGQAGAEVRGNESRPRLGAELPAAPSAYVPLSTRQKFNRFLRTTYEPYTFFSAAFSATLAQAEGQWYGYGGGMPGWGKRLGASVADTESRRFIQGFVLSTVLHQDPRYFRSRSSSKIQRGWYAVTRVLVTKCDDGHDTFNSAEFLGALFTTSLQNAYYPDRDRTFGKTMDRFVGALSSDASSNLLEEFWPDIRRLFRKHAPEEIKKIEEEMPHPPQD